LYYHFRYGENKSLRDKYFYFSAVREKIRLNGDTDTNGCIVGGQLDILWEFEIFHII